MINLWAVCPKSLLLAQVEPATIGTGVAPHLRVKEMAVLMLILALFGFGISMGLLCLGIIGAILTVVLRILAGVLWVIIKLIEHRKTEPEILIIIEEDEPPYDAGRYTPTQGDQCAAHYARPLALLPAPPVPKPGPNHLRAVSAALGRPRAFCAGHCSLGLE
jgi:hypothetical protein